MITSINFPRIAVKHVRSFLCNVQFVSSTRTAVSQSRSVVSNRQFMEPYGLTIAQRAFLIPYFGVGAIMDPTRGDLVAGFGDVLSSPSNLRKLKKRMQQTEEGRRILREKPLITEKGLDMDSLRRLPTDTLGYNYAMFMDEHGFSADERSKVRFMQDPDLAYIVVRYRQVHDFWHVLCGVPISVLGEVSLKWFEWRAMGMLLPSAALSGLLGPMRLSSEEKQELLTVHFPWAIQAGGSCQDLLGYDYMANLHKSLGEVRDDLGIEPFRPSEQ